MPGVAKFDIKLIITSISTDPVKDATGRVAMARVTVPIDRVGTQEEMRQRVVDVFDDVAAQAGIVFAEPAS